MIKTYISFALIYIMMYISIYWLVVFYRTKNKKDKIKINHFPFISVLIPAHNEEKNIRECIRSVLNQDYPKDKYEVIVIDDESTDNTGEIARSFGVKVLRKKSTGRKANALNYGLKYVKGDLVCVLDADTILSKDSFKSMVIHFNNKNVAAVITDLKVKNSKGILGKIQFFEYLLTSYIRRLSSFVNSLHFTHGGGTTFRKDILLSLGGFDEDNLTEDFEIALRLVKNGYRIINSKGVAYTIVPTKIKDLFKQRIRWFLGYIENLKKYKCLLFNLKYGNLAFFVLPIYLVTIGIVFYNFIMGLDSLFRFVKDIFLTNDFLFTLSNWVGGFRINTTFILSSILLTTFLFSIYAMFKLLNEKDKKPVFYSLVFYLPLYYFLFVGFWIVTFISKFIRGEKTW